jgi:membrane-bound lytic murein transglycosylase D
MRVAKLQIRTGVLAVLALAASGCQTAQKPVPLLPPKSAPSLTAQATGPASATPPQTVSPAPPQEASAPQSQTPVEPDTKAQASPSPAADPVGDLITRVEKDYQAGLDAYNAGKTDAAKQDFDNAFNALLGSELDVKSDDRLENEFNRIVDGVNHLDLGALGFSSDSEAQKTEPAPIDETNDITLSADAKLKAKAQAEIKSTHSDLPLMMTDQVAGISAISRGAAAGPSSALSPAPAAITT